jgi:hypothetical protein
LSGGLITPDQKEKELSMLRNVTHVPGLRGILWIDVPVRNEKSTRDRARRMYLKLTGSEAMDWIHLAQDRDQRKVFVSTAKKLRVP